jgi:signal transduction histidine kinase
MICQSIVEAHGGHLWMMDNVPQGTTFQFTLPVDAGNVPSIAERVL